MKRKEAIKKLRKGKIQIFNDKGNDKEFIKLFFEAFPDSEHKNDKVVLSGYNYGLIDFSSYKFNFVKEKTSLKKGIKIIKLSSITKPKTKNRLKQLEKGYSELKSLVSVPAEVKFKPDFENVKAKDISGWYKDKKHPKWIMYFDFENKMYYGFDVNGNWHTAKENYVMHSIKIGESLCSPQEVEQALIAEAKKRGYEKAKNIQSLKGDYIVSLKESGRIEYESNENTLTFYGSIVFKNGIWAEIIKETPIKEDEIDWSKPQLLISKEENKVLLTSGNHIGLFFESTVIVSTFGQQDPGYFSNGWVKDCFKPFKGTLTINKE